MTDVMPGTETRTKGATTEIQPFEVWFPDAALDDLRRRIEATRWPEKETVTDASQGVQLETAQKLANYWATEYDWRKAEAKLNALPQFVTNIDGLDIHFLHIRSKHEDALPLIITHGWPGSILEQLKIVAPLTDPTTHGGQASDAFHLVIPSLPGFGLSGKPTGTGWGPERIATAWATLMQRLGYERWVAAGGDWGGLIVDVMGTQQPPGLLGIHSNLAFTVPPEIAQAAQAGTPTPSGLSADESHAYDQLVYFLTKGLGYAIEMGNRPQTMYGLSDSPIALATWFLDHDLCSYLMIARAFNGESEGLTRDDVLDNITLTWLTNTGVSASRIYWENKTPFLARRNVTIPVAVSAFPDELYQAPRSWAEQAYPGLVYYNRLPKGGHFAAWEQPELYVSELRAGFRTLR